MNLKMYKQLLAVHDWYYSFSDDSRSYNRGLEEERQLKQLAEGKKTYEKAFQTQSKKHFK